MTETGSNMIEAIKACCLYKDGILSYVIAINPKNSFIFNGTTPINTDFKIIHNGNIFENTGSPATGIPGIVETHFYYPVK